MENTRHMLSRSVHKYTHFHIRTYHAHQTCHVMLFFVLFWIMHTVSGNIESFWCNHLVLWTSHWHNIWHSFVWTVSPTPSSRREAVSRQSLRFTSSFPLSHRSNQTHKTTRLHPSWNRFQQHAQTLPCVSWTLIRLPQAVFHSGCIISWEGVQERLTHSKHNEDTCAHGRYIHINIPSPSSRTIIK